LSMPSTYSSRHGAKQRTWGIAPNANPCFHGFFGLCLPRWCVLGNDTRRDPSTVQVGSAWTPDGIVTSRVRPCAYDISSTDPVSKVWTPDGIVVSRDGVSLWVHRVHPVSRCPMGQGGARRLVPFGIRAQSPCAHRKMGSSKVGSVSVSKLTGGN
jgi:hypothetical protein